MDKKTVLIISEHPADFYSLTASLDRADPPRFKPVTVNTRDQPVDALMDPANDAVILAYTLETEYLLRLAQKKGLAVPIIVLIDQEFEAQIAKLKEAGATDYLVRGLVSDDMLHRILDYSIVLNHISVQHEQVLQQQRIERNAQLAGERLRGVAQAVGDRAGAPGESAAAIPEQATTGTATVGTDRAGGQPESGAVVNIPGRRIPAASLTMSMLVLVAGIALLLAVLQFFRLDSESRLSSLEASNDLLARQVSAIHSELTRSALANAQTTSMTAAPVTGMQPPATATAGEKKQEPEYPFPDDTGTAPGTRDIIDAETPGSPDEALTPDTGDPSPRSASPEVTVTAAPVSAAAALTPLIPEGEGDWFVNLRTFSSGEAARRFARSLQPSSQRVEIQPVNTGSREMYRVRVVDLAGVEEAEALATDYQIRLGGDRPWVGRD